MVERKKKKPRAKIHQLQWLGLKRGEMEELSWTLQDDSQDSSGLSAETEKWGSVSKSLSAGVLSQEHRMEG